MKQVAPAYAVAVCNDNDRPASLFGTQVARLVSPAVAARLDEGASYGLWHFGPEWSEGPAEGRRTHRKNPSEDWVEGASPDAERQR